MVNHSRIEKVMGIFSYPLGIMIAGPLAVYPTKAIMLKEYWEFVNAVRRMRKFL